MHITLEQVGIVVAILTPIATAIYFCVKEYKKLRLGYRKKFQLAWTNEGDVTMNGKESHYVDIDIKTDLEDGEILGIVNSRKLKADNKIRNISINGKLKYKTAIVRFTHVRRGQVLDYGKAKLTLKGKLLHWRLIKGDLDNFPKSIVMMKQGFSKYDEIV